MNKAIQQWLEFWFIASKEGNRKCRDYWHTVINEEIKIPIYN